MGFNFRRSIKIAPGVKVNVGKKGASVSVGKRGATVNISKRGVRSTVGIPGTGLSYTHNHSRTQKTEVGEVKQYSKSEYIVASVLFLVIAAIVFAAGSSFVAGIFAVLGVIGFIAASGVEQ